MKHVLIIAVMLFSVLLFVDCRNSGKPAKQLTLNEKSVQRPLTLTYEEGLDTCTALLVKNSGLDSVTARKRCRCMYESYREIDSTFTTMEPVTRQEFMQKYADEVIARCDSLIPVE